MMYIPVPMYPVLTPWIFTKLNLAEVSTRLTSDYWGRGCIRFHLNTHFINIILAITNRILRYSNAIHPQKKLHCDRHHFHTLRFHPGSSRSHPHHHLHGPWMDSNRHPCWSKHSKQCRTSCYDGSYKCLIHTPSIQGLGGSYWGWYTIFYLPSIFGDVESRGPNLSADLASIVWRSARKICRKRFSSVGGSDMSFWGLPHFLGYNRYLASPMVVPAGWPYREQNNPCPTSSSCACLAPCSPNTECRPGKSPALKVLRADTFPFPYRYEVVSEPVR